MLRFQKVLQTELGPEFDCIHCRRPEYEKEHAGNCPRCPRTWALDAARSDAAQEARDVLGIEPDDNDLKDAEAVYVSIGKALSSRGSTLDPDWTCQQAFLARVILYEESRSQAIDHWDSLQRMKSQAGRRRR